MIVFCRDRVVADRITVADTFVKRLKGLMGKKGLAAGEGLLLLQCSSVHCFFMKMMIDAVYLSEDMTVLGVKTLAPWKIGRRIRNTAHVLELAAGTAQVSAGEKLSLSENWR